MSHQHKQGWNNSHFFKTTTLLVWVLVLISTFQDLHARRYFWVAGETVGQWNDDGNWSGEGLPGLLDEATMSGGNAVVSQAQVGTLILFGQLASGKLEVFERAFVSNSLLSLGHQLVLQPEVPTVYDGLNPMRITGNSQIINHGIFQIFAEGPLQFESGGSFLNQTKSENDPTAQFIIHLDPMFGVVDTIFTETQGANATFINKGAEYIQRSPGGINTIDLPFHNNGVVSAEKGTIIFKKGGLHSHGAFLTQGTNEIVFAEGEHLFELDQGDIQMGKGIVWSGGDFRMRKMGGKIKAEGLTIRKQNAKILGTGLLEIDDLVFEPPNENATFEVLGATQVKVNKTPIFRSPKGQILVDGTLRVASPALVLQKDTKLINRSLGDILFAGENEQSIRDIDGVSTFENNGTVKYLSPSILTRIPLMNNGHIEFGAGLSRFTKEFDSSNGTLSISPVAPNSLSIVELEGKTKIGKGASIKQHGTLSLLSTEAIELEGEFNGKGVLQLKGSPLSILLSGNVIFNGPDIEIPGLKTVRFESGKPSSWKVNTLERMVWKFGERMNLSSPPENDPLQIINHSPELLWSLEPGEVAFPHSPINLSRINLVNEGTIKVISRDGANHHIEFELTTVDNHGALILGEGTDFFNMTLTVNTKLTNTPEGIIHFSASRTNRISELIQRDIRFVNSGELKLEKPGAKLILENSTRHAGDISLNQGHLILKNSAHTFGRDAAIHANGSEPSSMLLDRSVVTIEDKLSFDGPVTFQAQGQFADVSSSRIEIPLSGHFKTKSLQFDTPPNRKNPIIQVTIPDSFIPGSSIGQTFTVLQSENLTGLKKENVSIGEIKNTPVNYEIEITPQALNIKVVGVTTPPDSGFEESFEEWINEHFDPQETKTKPEDDPDGDGKSNLHEYGTGSDPSKPDKIGLEIEIIEENGQFKVELKFPKSSTAKGVSVGIEQSSTIDGTFEPIDPEELESATERPSSTNPNQIEVQLPIIPKSTRTRFFKQFIRINNP